jgi:hypothetical protein
MTTSRTDFNETWLTEMPMGIGSFHIYDMVEYNIKDRIRSGSKVIDLGNNLKKIDGKQTKYYWYESNGRIDLGVELSVRPQGLVVNALGKNPKLKGHAPYASDLYDSILKDNNRSIKLLSDTQISDDAYELWKRLFKLGHTITIYDSERPGQTMQTFDSVDEMRKFFAYDNTLYKRYQYVLSESGEMLAETRSYFNTRRLRELTPGLL